MGIVEAHLIQVAVVYFHDLTLTEETSLYSVEQAHNCSVRHTIVPGATESERVEQVVAVTQRWPECHDRLILVAATDHHAQAIIRHLVDRAVGLARSEWFDWTLPRTEITKQVVLVTFSLGLEGIDQLTLRPWYALDAPHAGVQLRQDWPLR